MSHLKKIGLLMLCCFGMGACGTSSMLSRDAFEKSMKDYNRLVRWQEAETAGMLYIEPELRETFMKAAESFRKRRVSISDYRFLTTECDPEKGTAEVVAQFDYFILPSSKLKTLTYRQNWVYREINDKKGWKLKNSLPDFE